MMAIGSVEAESSAGAPATTVSVVGLAAAAIELVEYDVDVSPPAFVASNESVENIVKGDKKVVAVVVIAIAVVVVVVAVDNDVVAVAVVVAVVGVVAIVVVTGQVQFCRSTWLAQGVPPKQATLS